MKAAWAMVMMMVLGAVLRLADKAGRAEKRAEEAEAWAEAVEAEAQAWVEAAGGWEGLCVTADKLHFLPEEWTREEIEEVYRRCEP